MSTLRWIMVGLVALSLAIGSAWYSGGVASYDKTTIVQAGGVG